MYDAPYRIEVSRRQHKVVYEVHRTGEGKIAKVYSLGNARRIVEALNKTEWEKGIVKTA